jgi:hypothetical protein
MANESPFSGAGDASGGYILPTEQGQLLTNGVLQEAGALSLAGDARTTSSRKELFPIWNGTPTAEFVGEGGTKPVTGGEFGQGTLTIHKLATIVVFTDEMIDDVQNGDLNVLVDSGVRSAIADKIDEDAIDGSNFDSQYLDTDTSVALGDTQDSLALGVSAAMGSLEANGYTDFGFIGPADLGRHLRDAREVSGGTAQLPTGAPLYQASLDPLYGIPRSTSTNLDSLASGGTVGILFSRPNVHVRIRQDVTVARSNEATVGGTSLWQNDLTGVRYVTRLGMYIHDLDRAVVAITK